jgi:hypothetical protein
MNHPFAPDFTDMRDDEVELKLNELMKKYHMAYRMGNQELLTQLATFVNIYKEELSNRFRAKITQSENGDLGELINVD